METDNLPKISEDLFTLMWRLGSTFFKKDEFYKVIHLPPSQVKVLFHLMHHGPSTMTHLSQSLCISKPNMTPIIDKLLQEGYVRRLENPKDRRKVLIETTESACKLFEAHRDHVLSQLALRLSPLDTADLSTIHSCVQNILPILDKIEQ